MTLSLNEAIRLYRKMRDVPTTSDKDGVDRLDIAYDAYLKGTDIEDVWRDIERQCPEFSIGDAMNGKYEVEMTEGQAYINGWNACMAGVDGRYVPLREDGYSTEELRDAWYAGFQDAMDCEDEDEEPDPESAGFGPA